MALPQSELPHSEELPIYVLKQLKVRAIIPKVLSLLVLGAIFYLGILLNLYLLELTAPQEEIIRLVSLILLFSIIALGLYFTIHKANQPYKFYNSRIEQNKKVIYYLNIANTAPHQDPLDRIFKTYSIKLSDDFFLRNIPEQVQMQNYLQQLIDYARKRR